MIRHNLELLQKIEEMEKAEDEARQKKQEISEQLVKL